METLGRGRGASAPKRYAYTPAACRLASWHLLWVTGDEWLDGDGESGRKLLGKRGGGDCEKGELWIKEKKWEGGKKIGAAKGVEWKSWGCWIKIERKEGKKDWKRKLWNWGERILVTEGACVHWKSGHLSVAMSKMIPCSGKYGVTLVAFLFSFYFLSSLKRLVPWMVKINSGGIMFRERSELQLLPAQFYEIKRLRNSNCVRWTYDDKYNLLLV